MPHGGMIGSHPNFHQNRRSLPPWIRVAKLEAIAEKSGERLAQIDVRLARIEAKQDEFTKHYATKADLTDAKNSIIVWVVAAVFLAQLLPVVAGLVKHYFP